ncbi:MAG TPA: winged helix-turn-helix transcriptional regulator [Methanotrichaceae archaeon]|nr:winged helix-turn-helix transcriptional regulator [Methanotrichaceae archaeon]
MASYKERIMKAIEDSDGGLTTVDVAKRAGVSKTTVIKYLSVLKSEGRCEFVEVGPSKLWKSRTLHAENEEAYANMPVPEGLELDSEAVQLQLMGLDNCRYNCNDQTIALSFKIKPDQICAIMRKAKKCVCH